MGAAMLPMPRYTQPYYLGLAMRQLRVLRERRIYRMAALANLVNRIVRSLLKKANEERTGRLWASLSDVLPLLSEAAPCVFLEAVDEGLSGDHPVLLNLFTDADQRESLFTSSPHTGLLWALENLAWNSDQLGHTALLLAKLASLDPGGSLHNRPLNSLREIFLPWHPQTNTPIDRRLSVLDALRIREPEVAWRLFVLLLPKQHDSAHSTHAPRWRDWQPDVAPQVPYDELHQMAREILDRLLTCVGTNGQRWQDLVNNLAPLSGKLREKIIEHLLNVNVAAFDEDSCIAVQGSLRKMVSRHRKYPNTYWAMPEEQVDRLAEACQRFEPTDPVQKYKWLFSYQPPLWE
jgi:hypothetical protein